MERVGRNLQDQLWQTRGSPVKVTWYKGGNQARDYRFRQLFDDILWSSGLLRNLPHKFCFNKNGNLCPGEKLHLHLARGSFLLAKNYRTLEILSARGWQKMQGGRFLSVRAKFFQFVPNSIILVVIIFLTKWPYLLFNLQKPKTKKKNNNFFFFFSETSKSSQEFTIIRFLKYRTQGSFFYSL